jgi:UPF0716 protein FxsA
MRIMLVFAVVALAELATFIYAQSVIGLGPTLLIALCTALLGSVLVRRAGLSVWNDLQRKVAGGGIPTRELSHGASILVAGAFLISPGFITDTIGFLLLIPAVRDRVHRAVSKRVQNRVTVVTSGFAAGSGFAGGYQDDPTIIDAEGWEVSEEEPYRDQLP